MLVCAVARRRCSCSACCSSPSWCCSTSGASSARVDPRAWTVARRRARDVLALQAATASSVRCGSWLCAVSFGWFRVHNRPVPCGVGASGASQSGRTQQITTCLPHQSIIFSSLRLESATRALSSALPAAARSRPTRGSAVSRKGCPQVHGTVCSSPRGPSLVVEPTTSEATPRSKPRKGGRSLGLGRVAAALSPPCRQEARASALAHLHRLLRQARSHASAVLQHQPRASHSR